MAFLDPDVAHKPRYFRSIEQPPLPGERESDSQEGISDPDKCAKQHLRAVRADIKALNELLNPDKPFDLTIEEWEKLANRTAVFLELLPNDKRDRLGIALNEGLFACRSMFNDMRTLVTEKTSFFSFLGASPKIKEILKG